METSRKKSSMKAKTMSELLPSLTGLVSKEVTARKQLRTTVFKPLTLAEMRAVLQVLNTQSPRRVNQPIQSAKKRSNPVKKVLNFKPKLKPVSNPKPRSTIQNTETPKYPVPEPRAEKTLYHLQAQDSVRISGINNIPPTPVITKPAITKGRSSAGKENIPKNDNLIRKTLAPPIPKIKIFPAPETHLQNTPLLNSSWISGSDASFLQKEKEINDMEEIVKGIAEAETLENLAEVSPPESTPFQEYRSVQEYFNHSSCLENSAMYNTIMCFGKPSTCHHDEHSNGKKEESVIVSPCDLLNKATVTNVDKSTAELDSQLEEERQIEKNIRSLDHAIKVLTYVKEIQIKSLKKRRDLSE